MTFLMLPALYYQHIVLWVICHHSRKLQKLETSLFPPNHLTSHHIISFPYSHHLTPTWNIWTRYITLIQKQNAQELHGTEKLAMLKHPSMNILHIAISPLHTLYMATLLLQTCWIIIHNHDYIVGLAFFIPRKNQHQTHIISLPLSL